MSLKQIFPRRPFFNSLARSSYTLPVSRELLQSSSFNYINPRDHVVGTDTVSQTIPQSDVSTISDEKILALFTSGFFGGFVFGFEGLFMRMGGHNLLPARFTGFKADPSAPTIWNSSGIPNTHLLPTGSCLFGSFILLDKHISSSSSYVDYGFGSDESNFAGCHRFQITKLPVTKEVQVELQHFRCNPKKNQPSPAEPFERFHFVYAKSLFANAIQSMLTAS